MIFKNAILIQTQNVNINEQEYSSYFDITQDFSFPENFYVCEDFFAANKTVKAFYRDQNTPIESFINSLQEQNKIPSNYTLTRL